MQGQKRQRTQRIRKRVAAQFGVVEPLLNSGFTLNVSARGLALSSHTVHPVGTRLQVDLKLPGGERCRVEVIVAWAQRGLPALGMPGSMGLRLATASERYQRFVSSQSTSKAVASPVIAPPTVDDPLSLWAPLPELTPGPHSPSPFAAVPPSAFAPGAPRPFVAPLREQPKAPRPLGPRVPRFDEQLPLRIGLRTESRSRGFSLNLSRTGLALATQQSVTPGARVEVSLTLPEGEVARTQGEVVWARERAQDPRLPISLGVRLLNTDALYVDLVHQLAQALTRSRS